MRVLGKYKKTLKLRVERFDDLWHLSHILKNGDYLSGLTSRSVRVKEGGSKERKTVWLEIRVDNIEFQEFSGNMRVKGVITSAPEEIPTGRHHTFLIEPGSEIKIKKDEWREWELERMKEARTSQPRVGLVVMDKDSALIGVTAAYGVQTRTKIDSHYPRKGESGFEQAQRTYFGEVAKALPDTDQFIIGGPGFAKDNFAAFLKEKNPEVFENSVFTSTSTSTETGFREIVANKLDSVLKHARISKENKLVKELVNQIRNNGPVTYGLEKVKNAAEQGAIKTLLVGEEFLVKKRMGEELDRVMELTRNQNGKVEIVSKHTEAGKKLEGLGGIAALLRYKIYS